jgi:hypothetical protein
MRLNLPLQDVSGVAREVHNIVQVELRSLSKAKGRVAWMTTCDRYGDKENIEKILSLYMSKVNTSCQHYPKTHQSYVLKYYYTLASRSLVYIE